LAWEKPGFFAAMKLSRGAKKIEETLTALRQELPAITEKAAAWQARIAALRWSQAEILQIMEEIERAGAAALLPYFAARHTLASTQRRLLHLLGDRPAAESTALIVQALGGAAPTRELDMAQRVQALSRSAAAQLEVQRWLAAGDFTAWETTLPAGEFAASLQDFLARYGHRGLHEGEIAAPRWAEAPAPLFAAVLTGGHSAAAPAPADVQPLLAAVDGKARKEVKQLLAHLDMLLTMQSDALHAFSYILAGTREWAIAAGREALTDHRITALEAIFFYELEEVKEMMTGEWNVSDLSAIHATAAARRTAWEGWRAASPPALFWGDRPAQLRAEALPAACGSATGAALSLDSLSTLTSTLTDGAILLCSQPESAVSALLPVAAAFVAAQGDPLDPLCACARSLGRPGVVAARTATATVSPSARVAVDGTLGRVMHL
jgi:pyruvate,water dikinase